MCRLVAHLNVYFSAFFGFKMEWYWVLTCFFWYEVQLRSSHIDEEVFKKSRSLVIGLTTAYIWVIMNINIAILFAVLLLECKAIFIFGSGMSIFRFKCSLFIWPSSHTDGCPKISQRWLVDTKKDVIYPKGSLSLDPFRAPVQRLSESSKLTRYQLTWLYCIILTSSWAEKTNGFAPSNY